MRSGISKRGAFRQALPGPAAALTAAALVLSGAPAALAGPRPLPLLTVGLGVPAPPDPAAAPNFAAVRLTWAEGDPGSSPVLRYTVYRGVSELAMFPYAEVEVPAGGGAVSYVDRGTDSGVTYLYSVTATNAAGESPRSPVVSASPTPIGVVFATAKWTGRDDAYDIALLSGGVISKLNTDDGDHQTPAVAPDGSAVVYTSNHGNGPGDYDLWLQRQGEGAVRLTSGAGADGEPAFSPDGRTIAFTRFLAGRPSVWTVPVAGGPARRVPGTAGENQPAWAPSGRMLAVAHVFGLRTSIVVTNLDGTVRRPVAGTVSARFPAYDPSFSPDGTAISFVQADEAGGAVAVVPAEGGTPHVLTPRALAVAAQQWAPGGERIVFEGYSESTPGTVWSVDPTTGEYGQEPGAAGEAGLSPTPAEEAAPYVALSTPDAVTGLGATLGRGSVDLRWSAPGAAPGTWYAVRRSGPDGAVPRTPEDGIAVGTGPASAATATGLASGHRYAFAVFPVSPAGDAGPAAVLAARPAPAPMVRLGGGVLSALRGDGPSFAASWGPALPAGQRYEVQVGTRRFDEARRAWGAVAWQSLSRGAATAAVVDAVPGTTYHLRARVRDGDGNATPWGPVAVAAVPYDDRDLAADGVWRDLAGQAGRFAGTLRASDVAGSTLSMRVWGSKLALVADRCAACGLLEVYVDGEKVATVDTNAPSLATRRIVWSHTYGSIGRHLVTLRVVGTGEHRLVRVDGLAARR